MTDNFACLGVQRRPWLEPDDLKRRFLALSSETHPDRVHAQGAEERRGAQDDYARLNASYQCLREPRDRLRHLIELERGTKPSELQEIPASLMQTFLDVGSAGREVDVFLAEKEAITSPLLKLQYFERGQEWTERLSGLQRRITAGWDGLLAELRSADAAWQVRSTLPEGTTSLLDQLERLYRLFSYYGRWNSQVQERIMRLTL